MSIHVAAPFTSHGPSLFDSLETAIHRAFVWRAARRRYRTMRDELETYSPQQLAELGLREADIDFVAEDAAQRRVP